ncbi:Tom22p Ecym_8189 [Eremothecium cymbalariae DBVPG|uniref:Mitochondrial import receptor subunit TOM22 n=1 Tax=Eremothecium cymbalariae (strain CBS 270.75 / DBVPG 7215 / KCTC 17166 / NRRL Y-17582) TaxID=931890 RepID=G8JXA0_ERECY|nr:Hypothetical protein Ecym_8189 [Eremothecium cymbalariae DBVPG\
MVELTEITEESQILQKEQKFKQNGGGVGSEKSDSLFDDEDYSSDDDDDFDENETFFQRFLALKDIIAPQQWQRVNKVYDATVSMCKVVFSKSGNVLWAVTTSALLLGVPLSLSILAEQQLIEMEKSFDLQKDANDILATGDSPNPAPQGI